jgi:hypothetical protein
VGNESFLASNVTQAARVGLAFSLAAVNTLAIRNGMALYAGFTATKRGSDPENGSAMSARENKCLLMAAGAVLTLATAGAGAYFYSQALLAVLDRVAPEPTCLSMHGMTP